MLRCGFATIAIVAITSAVNGQSPGTIVSHHLAVGAGDRVLGVVSNSGLIITDVFIHSPADLAVRLDEISTEGEVQRLATGSIQNNGLYSFRSGIPFAPGTTIGVDTNSDTIEYTITVMGYIPGPTAGNAPAVGTWGMIILGCVILIAGSRVIMQRRIAA